MARSGCGTFGSSQNVNSEHNGTSHHRHCIELVEFGSFPLDSRQEFAHIYRWLCRMHHGYLRCTSRYRWKFSKWCLKKFFKKHYFLVLKKNWFYIRKRIDIWWILIYIISVPENKVLIFKKHLKNISKQYIWFLF